MIYIPCLPSLSDIVLTLAFYAAVGAWLLCSSKLLILSHIYICLRTLPVHGRYIFVCIQLRCISLYNCLFMTQAKAGNTVAEEKDEYIGKSNRNKLDRRSAALTV